MTTPNPVLHLVCGKAASGKSSLCTQLGSQPATVIISEDEWLSALFADEMRTLQDYVRCSAMLRQIMQPHVASLLTAGVSVVLDFPANTIDSRKWMLQIIMTTGVEHQLHYLDVPDELCKARLRERNETGDHPFAVTDEQFDKLSAYFQPPTETEGFAIMVHKPD